MNAECRRVRNFVMQNSLFNLPAHASWRKRLYPIQVMLHEKQGSIIKIELWQAGIRDS